MWNQTYGLSAHEAVARYESNGWSIATNSQMANLFNSFKLGETGFPLPYPRSPFVSDENADQLIGPHGDSQDANNSAAIAFIKLFSDQELDFQAGVEQIHAHAYFGDDEDNDNKINRASVNHDHFPDFGFIVSDIGLSSDNFGYTEALLLSTGTALVRNINEVNSPNSLFLLIMGMFLLVRYRRK
ncbi:hypothetical protein [uncultured Alteromonas sp.]|jgi:hypothetical protein|uniref:hypothetical protein n=1 Tax=uncultured Alteromonas sp. TaxID=179113 RepID=UPI0025E4AC5F|nr:hypothetical protein [uncultured Alteromonas sp.]